jgi:hypothetical protein
MANNRITLRRTSTAAKQPSTSDIATGELGLNMTDQILYSHNGSTVFAIGNNLPVNHVANTLYVGNSTVNASINSTAIVIGNSSVNTLVVNTYISGNGYGLTSITASASPGGSNTQIQFNDSATTAGDANLTWTKTTSMLTLGNSSVNVAVNTTALILGNVGGSISVTSPTVMVGNSTQNATINATSFRTINSTANTTIVPGAVFVGNTCIIGDAAYVNPITYGGVTPASFMYNDTTYHALRIGTQGTGGQNTIVFEVPTGGSYQDIIAMDASSVHPAPAFDGAISMGQAAGRFSNTYLAGAAVIGNSTVNAVINTTSIVIGNGSVNTFVVNTYISGNGYGITSISATASPAGANTQLQYNNSSSLAASPNLTFNYATAVLCVGNATGTGSDGRTVINSTACFSTGNLFYTAVTGDQYGNVSLILKNRDFWNGVMFKNESMPLVDMMFSTSNSSCANNTIRFETRAAGGISEARNANSGEIEIGQVATSNWYMVLGNGAIICKSTIPFSANVPLDSGLASNSLGIYVKAGSGVAINSTGTHVVAGNSTIVSNSSGIFANVTAGGTPGGANTQIQFNDSGSFGGENTFIWNKSTDMLTIGNSSIYWATNSSICLMVDPSGNVTKNSTSVVIGNSTVYSISNSSTELWVGVGSNTLTNSSSEVFVGSVSNLATNSTTLFIGNSTVNTIVNSSSLKVVDTATVGNCAVNSTSVLVGNATIKVTINTNSFSTGGVNSTAVGTLLSNAALTLGNSSVNVVINTIAVAFNSTATVVNSASFTNTGAQANGTYVLPNGYRAAWGLCVANSIGVNVVTFGTAFTTNAFSVQITPISNSTVFCRSQANAITKTGFTIYVGNATSHTNTGIPGVFWYAFGS